VYDEFKTSLDLSTVVHVWLRDTNVTEVVANGYDVLVNVGYVPHSWYLDNLNVNWKAVYQNVNIYITYLYRCSCLLYIFSFVYINTSFRKRHASLTSNYVMLVQFGF
jgi:hypothetical protein